MPGRLWEGANNYDMLVLFSLIGKLHSAACAEHLVRWEREEASRSPSSFGRGAEGAVSGLFVAF